MTSGFGRQWTLKAPDPAGPRTFLRAIATVALLGLCASLLAVLAGWSAGYLGVGASVAVVVIAGLKLARLGGSTPVGAEGGVVRIGDERWPTEAIGWATYEAEVLTILGVDGVPLHRRSYEHSPAVEELVDFLRSSAPAHSDIEATKAHAERVHREAEALERGRS